QDARPERDRHRRRNGAGRRHRALDGDRDHRVAQRSTHPPAEDLAAGYRVPRGSIRKDREMTNRSKTLTDAHRKYDRERLYAPAEALDIVKSLATRKFDETVEAAFRLGVDPRKADQMIRGTVSLPHGTGKSVRVAVFAAGDLAREAEEAGAAAGGAADPRAPGPGGRLRFHPPPPPPRPLAPG